MKTHTFICKECCAENMRLVCVVCEDNEVREMGNEERVKRAVVAYQNKVRELRPEARAIRNNHDYDRYTAKLKESERLLLDAVEDGAL